MGEPGLSVKQLLMLNRFESDYSHKNGGSAKSGLASGNVNLDTQETQEVQIL